MPPQSAEFGGDVASQPSPAVYKEIRYIPGRGNKEVIIDPSKKKKLNWLHITLLCGIPIVALIGAFFTPLQPKTLMLACVTYFLTGFGITGGYHRMWSHKAWDAPAPVRFFILMWGAAAFQGSARWWCRNHRAHHKFTDTTKDPYNVRKGFMYAHFGWMMFKQDPEEVGRADISDLNADWMIRFQHKYYVYIAIFFSIVLPTAVAGLGWGDWWGGYFYAALARIVFVHHATFFVNSLAHYLGDQAYSDLHTAFDSFITALLTLGEGYHNYHHEFPQDYRNGIKWFQYDPTKWTITLLWSLGLAHDLRWIEDNEIKKATLQVKLARLTEFRNRLLFGRNLNSNLPTMTERDIQLKIDDGHIMLILENKVYDLSEFADIHPGGRDTMLRENGRDVTLLFQGKTGDHIHSKYAIAMLPRYLVGIYAGENAGRY